MSEWIALSIFLSAFWPISIFGFGSDTLRNPKPRYERQGIGLADRQPPAYMHVHEGVNRLKIKTLTFQFKSFLKFSLPGALLLGW